MLSIIRLSKDLSCLKKEKQGSHKTWKHSSNKGKYVHRLSLSFARKSVVRLIDYLNMTIVVGWDVKQQINRKTNMFHWQPCYYHVASTVKPV